ncbi:response regulator [Cohnella suwonensis]|uniref:Response regulator n=1 Tax=Cohnella suwonensis TaxID=696072 RepID=A0ABW0M090_9BACL
MYSLLIVDDELLVRNHLRTMINWERHGFVIAGEASNGQEALEFLARKKTDAVLSDIRMPSFRIFGCRSWMASSFQAKFSDATLICHSSC